MRLHPITGALLLACAIGSSSNAMAQGSEREALYLRGLAASCTNCHGTDGRAQPGSQVPPLAGRDKTEIVALIKAFQSGARPSTVMQQISKGYTDAQIAQLADFFAGQRK